MRIGSAAWLVLGLCILAGCGSTKVIVKTESGPQAATIVTTSGASPPGAGSSGLGPLGERFCQLLRTEPVCEYNGELTQHAQRAEALRLKTLTAKLVGVRAARSPRGEYLIITLKIRNDTSSPKTFGHPGADPTDLVAGGEYRKEALNAETNDPNSFITKNEPIQPGASTTADVIFDVPRSVAAGVMNQTDGGLFIANFGSDFSKHLPASGLGLISVATKPEPGA
jgi:hypothetical protein